MTYLFLDTSSDTLILSLIKNYKIIETVTLESLKEHSIHTVYLLDKILSNNSVKPEEVDKIFVVNGPGSFTGIRIGLTIAKTYAYTLQKDITVVSALKMSILQYNNYNNYVSIINDKNNTCFVGIYDKNFNTEFEGLISVEDLNNRISKLNNVKIYKLNENDNIRKNIDILKIIKYYDDKDTINPHNANPIYLKEVI